MYKFQGNYSDITLIYWTLFNINTIILAFFFFLQQRVAWRSAFAKIPRWFKSISFIYFLNGRGLSKLTLRSFSYKSYFLASFQASLKISAVAFELFYLLKSKQKPPKSIFSLSFMPNNTEIVAKLQKDFLNTFQNSQNLPLIHPKYESVIFIQQ